MEPIKDVLGTVRYDKEQDAFLLFKPGEGALYGKGYWAVYVPQRGLLDEDIDKHEAPMIGKLDL